MRRLPCFVRERRGLLCGVALLLAGAAILRLTSTWVGESPRGCLPADPRVVVLRDGQSLDIPVWPHRRCTATGVRVAAGERYRVDVTLPRPCTSRELEQAPSARRLGQWADGLVAVSAPAGLDTRDALRSGVRGLAHVGAWPLRPRLQSGWLAPILIVDGRRPQWIDVGADRQRFTAAHSGLVRITINEALLPCPRWDCLLANNAGGAARIRLTRERPDTAGSAAPLPPFVCQEQRELWAAASRSSR